jgi:hypothetical protein
MAPLQSNMLANFPPSMQTFVSRGYDYHVAVTTTDAYKANKNFLNDPTLAKFRDGTNQTSHTGIFVISPMTTNPINTFLVNADQGQNGDGDERAFSSFRESLNDQLNPPFLRVGGWLAIIILSDEDDFSNPTRQPDTGTDHDYSQAGLESIASQVSYLDGLTQSTGVTRRYNVSAISVLDSACQASHSAQAPSTIIGQRYMQLAQQTNGVLGSVCDASYANSLNAISNQIAVLSTQFYLQRTPDPTTIIVQVNGVNIPQDPNNGWSYDPVANSILFHGTSIPPQGASISINFQPTGVAH